MATPDVAEIAGRIVGQRDDRVGMVTRTVQEQLVQQISELRGDAQLLQLLRDTVVGSVETFFSTVRHNIPVWQVEVPTAALEYARRLAQRDVSANALVRAYRLGHKTVLRFVLDEVRESDVEPRLSLDVYEMVTSTSFEYIDRISQRVVAAYEEEREHWLENRNSMRALRVRELLSDAEVDVDAMTTAIRYPIRRTHLAIVVWCRESNQSDGLAPMERFVQALAESIAASASPLFIPVDQVTAWAWIPLLADAASTAVEGVREFAEAAPDAPWVAIGPPLPGVDGLRRSHQQAHNARTVTVASGATERRVTAAGEPGLAVAALLGSNVDAAVTWVGEVLGPLASATDSDDRLRETLRVFLRTGSSYTAAAEVLHLHYNSVKYRVQRAIERRGRSITDDRFDVELALILCRWFGAAVLS